MENPRTFPARHPGTVEREVEAYEAQRLDLEAMAAASGQAHALFIAPVELRLAPTRGAYSSTAWTEGRTSVLAPADVVILLPQPATIDDVPRPLAVRWDVVARVCAATCFDEVPGVGPTRYITRRWPPPDQLEVLQGLGLPEI